MDKNALTEKRRETVIGLLKGMNIKKASGEGFDKDDVYECMPVSYTHLDVYKRQAIVKVFSRSIRSSM